MNFRAGALRATCRDGELWHVRAGGREIAQRIYGAVRDRNWGTPPGRVEIVAAREDDFVFESIHQHGDLDFRWRGAITGRSDGTLSFAMDGRAHSNFQRNRIGLCVHHPLRECAGAACAIETADGRIEQSAFPEFVAPHQPFRNVRAMRYSNVEVRFEGDIFETEDHRNWTDANFKTYSTPLELAFPVELRAGDQVLQRIEIKAYDAGGAEQPGDSIVRVRARGPSRPMAAIGLTLGANPLSDAERRALSRLRLSHLRVDGAGQIERAANEAKSIGASLEIAVTLPCPIPQPAPRAARWLVYRHGEKATGAAAARELRQLLGRDAMVAAGTNAYFAELNRNRPDGDGWDAACFSVNPQVHAFDDESVMANAAAQYDVVRSAHRFLGGRGVAVSPVTLRPRFNPDATGDCEPPAPDPRQRLPFCAAWTVASLQALASAGAASVTYFETHGPRGAMDGRDLYPVYHVFEALGRDFRNCEISDPSRVAALAFGPRYLVANLTPAACGVEIDGAEHTLEPYEVRSIEGATWTSATESPAY